MSQKNLFLALGQIVFLEMPASISNHTRDGIINQLSIMLPCGALGIMGQISDGCVSVFHSRFTAGYAQSHSCGI
jgi:hypothetical protein